MPNRHMRRSSFVDCSTSPLFCTFWPQKAQGGLIRVQLIDNKAKIAEITVAFSLRTGRVMNVSVLCVYDTSPVRCGQKFVFNKRYASVSTGEGLLWDY